jgi:hypothetical protein
MGRQPDLVVPREKVEAMGVGGIKSVKSGCLLHFGISWRPDKIGFDGSNYLFYKKEE